MVLILNLVGMGGTFDHLHEGHRLLISTALQVSEKVVIGLATEELLKNKKYSKNLENYSTRKQNLINFIETVSELQRVEIIELNNRYGPPIDEEEYEGIVVSQETYSTALEINKLRKEKGFDPLIIIVIPILKDKDNQRISSTNIRKQMSKK